MNHAIFIVKVINTPIHLIYSNFQTIEVKVRFPITRKKNSINELTLLLWGQSKDDFLKYYKIQDYLIIEGILTLHDYKNEDNDANIVVKRLYPFLLI
uniref:hypothetical protein n=1 Tax=Ascoseira mirabilis TaxID=76830 RepID=UPI003002484C|nr:hypothetical protein ASMI161 [Ascoseira mirabilis]